MPLLVMPAVGAADTSDDNWMIFPSGLSSDERRLVKDFALMLVKRKERD